jgi:hypothetical protein
MVGGVGGVGGAAIAIGNHVALAEHGNHGATTRALQHHNREFLTLCVSLALNNTQRLRRCFREFDAIELRRYQGSWAH